MPFRMDFEWLLDRFLIDFGTHLGSQNRSKMDPRAIQNPSPIASDFWSTFSSIWDPFWIDFGSQDGPKIDPKSIQQSIKQTIDLVIWFESIFDPFLDMIQHGRGHVCIGKTNTILRFLFFDCCAVALIAWSIFDRFWEPLGLQNRSKIDRTINQQKWSTFWSILEPTWLHFGEVLGAKLGPSWLQNRSKKQSKNQ